MKKVKMLALVTAMLLIAGGAVAQTRGGLVGPPTSNFGPVGPTSEFDLYGITNAPSVMSALGDCTASPCSFQGFEEAVWAQNLRFAGANCNNNIKNPLVTVLDRTFTPVSGADYLSITFTGQAGIANQVAGALPQGLTLVCTVFQGTSSMPCPGTTALPFLVRQSFPSTGGRTGGLSYVSYHGMIDLDNDYEDVRVLVQVRVSDITNVVVGSLCYPFAELVQHYSPGV